MLAGRVKSAGHVGHIRGYVSHDEAPEVEDVEVPSQLQPLGVFFNWVRQPDTLRLKGHCYSIAGDHVGLTMQFVDRKGRVVASHDVTGPGSKKAKDDEKKVDRDPYLALLAEAAAWIRFELGNLRKRGAAPDFVGTTSWKSYAAFSVAQDAIERGDSATARRKLNDALALDHVNRAALLNLAWLDVDRVFSKDWSSHGKVHETLRAARGSFDALLEEVTGPGPNDVCTDSSWHRATYGRAVPFLMALAELRFQAEQGGDQAIDPEDMKEIAAVALKEANLLVPVIRATLAAEDADGDLETMLHRYKPEAMSVQLGAVAAAEGAGVELGQLEFDALWGDFEEEYGARVRTPNTEWGLACNFVARRGKDKGWAHKALAHLSRSVTAEQDWKADARYDPELKALRDYPPTKKKFAKVVARPPEKHEAPTVWTVTVH